MLCNTDEVETMSHLFFRCAYSNEMWQTLLRWLGIQRRIMDWKEEVCWVAKQVKKGKPRTEMIGWIFAALVYHVWKERNTRRFQQVAQPG